MRPPRHSALPRAARIALAVLGLLAAGANAAPATAGPPTASAPTQFNVLGREDAPVSIIEFSDLQCPYCARYALQTFPRLRAEYIDTGRVRYVVGDLPLPKHRDAVAAAIAARCAGAQDRYWEYREALFKERATLRGQPYDRLAGEFGLDLARFDACRQDPAQARHVEADVALAHSSGIASTPAFVIGTLVNGEFRGEVVKGARPYEYFAAKIDALLAESAR